MSARLAADCEEKFAKVMDETHYPDMSSKIVQWEALEPQCGGTGIYESRLGTFYMQSGRHEDAQRVLEHGLARKTGYEKELRAALAGNDFRQGKLDAAESSAVALIQEFPNWPGGHGVLGEVRLVQHRFEEGIEHLERANAIESTSGAHVLLAMAYYQIGRIRESAMSMQRALKLDMNALKHTQAVCATAYSLVALGHLPEAADLLTKHLKVQPNAAGDKTYQEATALVRKKLREHAAPADSQNTSGTPTND